MRYAVARLKEKQRDEAYRIYITDSLKLITENTAHFVEGGQYITKRWIEVVENKPTDNRSGEEIAMDVIKRAGLRFSGE